MNTSNNIELASDKNNPPVRVLAKGMDILLMFSSDEPYLTLAQISERLGQAKTTVHNILTTLRSRGFVEKANDGRYCLGKMIIPLTQAIPVNVELRDRSAPLLRQLSQKTGGSIYLGVLNGCSCLYIYAIETVDRLRARTAVGDHADLHCTGVGKAILAWLPEEHVLKIISTKGLRGYTPHTFTTQESLSEELRLTRERGYALDHEEHEEGTFCIAAPIFDAFGNVVGACSTAGFDPTILTSRLQGLSTTVVQTADEISRRMGYVPRRLSIR